MKDETKISRDRMVDLLNEDLAREYQAIIAYIIYSQTLKGSTITSHKSWRNMPARNYRTRSKSRSRSTILTARRRTSRRK